MIDTIGLISPSVSDEIAEEIEKQCVLRQGVDLFTGEVLYSLTTKSLEGSYDSKLSICIQREKWVSDFKTKKPVKVQCSPYLYLEGSVHKFMMGHNVYGGPIDFYKSAIYLITFASELLGVELPNFDYWTVKRIDVAECYKMPSFESVTEYFTGLNASAYPRRSVSRHGSHGLYVTGSTSTIKFYHKGMEFTKHDRKKLKKLIKMGAYDEDRLQVLQDEANKILRVEVEIKSRKLKDSFGGRLPYIHEVDNAYLDSRHDVDIDRLLKEGEKEMKIVRSAHEVRFRLFSMYGATLAGSLLGFWYQLTTVGEEKVKSSTNKATFYRYRKQLKDAGVSWLGSDVVLKESTLIPDGFTPQRHDPRRMIEESAEVKKAMEKVNDILKNRSNEKNSI